MTGKSISELLAQPATRAMGSITRAEGGEFSGIGISYTETYETPYFLERFEPGCAAEHPETVPVLRDHDRSSLVGKVISEEETQEGLSINAALSTTPLAEETRTLLTDGTLTGLSVGFKPLEWREEYSEEEERPLIIHERIQVLEYSLTAFPAYKSATVTQARHTERTEKMTLHPLSNSAPAAEAVTRDDFEDLAAALSDQVSNLERRAAAGEFTATASEGSELETRAAAFESLGDFVKAIAKPGDARHDDAMALYRDLTTSDIPSKAPAPAGWLGDLTHEITQRRPWTNTFSTGSLPSKGMTVDYIKTTKAATVAKQAKELSPLAKGASFAVEKFSAPVHTYGGANTLSQQVIDRSESWVISDMLRAMGLEYGAQTEQAVKAHILAEIDGLKTKHNAAKDAQHALEIATDFGAFDWIDTIIDAAQIFDDRNYELAHLAVSGDVFKKLAREAGSDGRPLLTLSGTGVNVVGQLNLPKSFGSLLGMPVKVINGAPEKTALFFDPIAVRTLESSGAPFHLQDQNVLNLSQDFSIYGYMAHLTPYPDALLPVVFA